MQQPMQQPMHQHNLKRKAAEPEDVAEEEEDSENEVVESPEIKRAKTEYLKRLYSRNKQQSEVVVVETEEKKKEEESHSKDHKAESQKKKSEGIWSNAKQSEVVVKDEGAGVADADKKQVFEKFYRSGDENTRNTKGTGLGLYLCKKIVEEHRGRITITDNMPKGSIFTVTLNLNNDTK